MPEIFDRIRVTPDTLEWLAERRKSVGASEAPAVMGLSSYADSTALAVYESKMGVDRRFDPLLAWIGHQSEPIIHAWVEEFSGQDVKLEPGFMARSIKWPFLHATFDRVSAAPFITWQFKTAHHYMGHHWDEGIPTDIRVQVQAEMAVAGTPRAAVVVWIGGRDFRLFWEWRDDTFIEEHLIPTVMNFWDANVRAQVPPPVSSVAEVNAIVTDGTSTELSAEAFDTLERILVLRSDIKAQEEEKEALTVALGRYVGAADVLLRDGVQVATFKQQKGRVGFDKRGFAAEHPDIHARFTTQGEPFRVLRNTPPKTESR